MVILVGFYLLRRRKLFWRLWRRSKLHEGEQRFRGVPIGVVAVIRPVKSLSGLNLNAAPTHKLEPNAPNPMPPRCAVLSLPPQAKDCESVGLSSAPPGLYFYTDSRFKTTI